MNVLAQLSDGFLARHFDAGTLQRAREVVAAGAVRRPEIGLLSAGSVTATAEVQGSREVAYQVQLHAEAPTEGYAGWLFTVCTCPVRSVCKHGAALALTLRQTFTQPAGEAAWRRSLEKLVAELDRHQPRPHDEVPLALEISLEEPRSHYRSVGPMLRVRPLRQGKNKPWIKTGADWSDVGLGGVAQGFPKAQSDAVSALHALWAGHRAYYYAGVAPSLDEFGENVVRALRNARDAGVTLLAARPLREIVIADDVAEVVAELTDVQGGTALRAAVSLGQETWRGEAVIPVGSPASVVGLLDDDGRLVLATTTAPVPPALRHLLDGPPIVVPPADLADFRDTLPGLMRHLPVRAEDAAVDLPEPLRPTLVLTVTWHNATKAGLSWSWRYGADRACPVTSSDPLGGVRDRMAERALLAAPFLPTCWRARSPRTARHWPSPSTSSPTCAPSRTWRSSRRNDRTSARPTSPRTSGSSCPSPRRTPPPPTGSTWR